MIDFSLTEEQEAMQQAFREFAQKEMLPLAEECDEKEEFPVPIFAKLGELGYMGLLYPEQYGGAGQGAITAVIMGEEFAAASGGITLSIYAHMVLALGPIAAMGSEAQKQKYLVPGIAGKSIGAWALTEPNAGSDVASMQAHAREDGDHWVINGSKMFITNGTLCDFAVVAAGTAGGGHQGISLFVVDRDAPGFTVGRKLKKFSVRSSDTAELVFSDCRVPKNALLGELHKGFQSAMRTLTIGRVIGGGFAVGLARGAYEAAMRYTRERVQFGKPIAANQVVQFMLADMATEIDAARLLAWRAAWLLDQGKPHGKEASMAKLFASEVCCRVTNKAVQLHGGYGLMHEYAVQRSWRDAKLLEIGEGTSEIQRTIIAKQLGL